MIQRLYVYRFEVQFLLFFVFIPVYELYEEAVFPRSDRLTSTTVLNFKLISAQVLSAVNQQSNYKLNFKKQLTIITKVPRNHIVPQAPVSLRRKIVSLASGLVYWLRTCCSNPSSFGSKR